MAGVVTQTRAGSIRPAEDWRDVAMGYFGLRFLLAYGPEVPDGFLDLDSACASENGQMPAPAAPQPDPRTGTPAGYVAFSEIPGKPPHAWFRSWEAAAAAARDLVAAARYHPHERIVTLLAQDDHRGLATGMMAALVAGCASEAHGLFDSATPRREPELWRSRTPGRTRLDGAGSGTAGFSRGADRRRAGS